MRNVELATTTNITTTYSGQASSDYIAAALFSATTIDDGGITVKSNVPYKEVLQRGATGSIVSDATCDFSPSSTLTLDEKILEPKELQVNLQVCKQDFYKDWQSASMGYGLNQTLPSKFSDFLIAHCAQKVAQTTETSIWSGASGVNGDFEGLVANMTADATVTDIAAIGGGLAAGNIIAEMSKVVAALPSAIYGQEDTYIYVNSKTARLYIQALGALGNGVQNMGSMWYNNGTLTIDGVNVFVTPGLADDTMVGAQASNLFFGTGILNDNSEASVLDMQPIDGSRNVRIIMRYTAGVQVGFGSDCVLYS